jgi:small subunit ribosomal protein S9|tara:strand:+ start:2958 stop:3428 length:471 start_codon:yes stop_codon:yes gene_type:complete
MVEISQDIIEVSNQEEKKSSRKIIKDALGRIHTVGKRKEAVARVFLIKGNGKITINNMELLPYFTRQELVDIAIKPLNITKNKDKFDIVIYARGGGKTGQSGAVSLGIARALNDFDLEANRQILKLNGLLTRDSRKVERKKYGLKKARKASTFRKR